ncbi:type II toxin-antitoxin system ParD family antitoxin [Pararhizobium antarcticum]|uniref:Addiction module antitoxin n=1 Tax=Pararhizobium antarcticum TaxID=1798805 RepID=A0A657M1R4_9HYPH|nr:type II toxin-antitoxin system ParD family antitoxin [Pararhizobium antarcticum]OJF94486.1 hypothetical protein AX761_18485 [Rhizobium sp. 58]OJG00700.1 hypothetical protein AX760_09495 [Pararhizobium antarcticum]
MADIQLSDEDEAFIEERVRIGPYKSAVDVIREGLHLLQSREEEDAEELRLLIQQAEDDVAAGHVYTFSSPGELLAHVKAMAAEKN